MLTEAKTIRNIALYSSNDSGIAFVHFKKNPKIGPITPTE
jgi:type IV secretory pathway component VirB8